MIRCSISTGKEVPQIILIDPNRLSTGYTANGGRAKSGTGAFGGKADQRGPDDLLRLARLERCSANRKLARRLAKPAALSVTGFRD